jgi:Gpi18-like mannosyltransferase
MRIWQSFGNWQVVVLWLGAVVYIFLAGWLGAHVLAPVIGWGSGIPDQVQVDPASLATMFARWDSGYYAVIAEKGYAPDGNERAFFPLYPIVVRGLSQVSGLSVWWSGLLVSVIAFGIACLIFNAWVRLDHPADVARHSTALLCFSPMAFYFVAFYAESLFLALSVAGLYLARRGHFVAGGIVLSLAGATRPTAFLLGLAFIAEVIGQRPVSTRGRASAFVGLSLSPIGAWAFYYFLGRPNGPVAGLQAYTALLATIWDTRYAWPWALVISAIKAALFGINIHADWFSRAYAIHDTLHAFGALIVSLRSARYMRLSAAILLLVSVLYLFVLHGPGGYAFDSAPRHLAIVAPIYLAVGLWSASFKYRWGLVVLSAMWLGVLTAWFASGRWVS